MAFNPESLPSKVYEAYKLGPAMWPLVVERAIEAKITNVNRVTDIMFYLHHPELKGRSLRSDETGLTNEWKGFREMIRRRVEEAARAPSTKTSENGLVLERSARPPDAYLADFDIGGHDLKTDHRDWLEEYIVQPDKVKSESGVNGRWLVRLTARASQSGSDDYNLALSQRRGDEVEKYLSGRIMAHRLGFARISLGEGVPLDSSSYENEMDRSVHVKAKFLSWGKPDRIEPLIPEIKPWRRVNKKAVDFTIQVLKAQVEVNSVGGGSVLPFRKGNIDIRLLLEVRELGNGDTAMYEYEGNGPYGHFDKPGWRWSEWLGRFENGGKHRFATERPMDAEDFGGGAWMKIDMPAEGLAENYTFGPKDSFLFPTKIKIKKLTFGNFKGPPPTPRGFNLTGDGMATGKMKLVIGKPSWAD